MKICVAVKWVVDSVTPVRVAEGGRRICMHDVKMGMDPLSQSALARAVAFKTARVADTVVAVTVGDSQSAAVLYTALAMGADTAVHVWGEGDTLTPMHTAQAIAQLVRARAIDMVLCGAESTDADNGQTGAMVASLLDLPYVTHATDIHMRENRLHITSVYDHMTVQYMYDVPVVIGCDTGVAVAKAPSLPRTLYVKHKPIDTIQMSDRKNFPPIQVVSLQSAMDSGQGAQQIDTQALFDIIA